MSDQDLLSADDLRDRLYHSLREKGLVDALKSQLRNRLVTELKNVGLSQSFHQEPKYAKEGSLLHKAANSLVADHLRRCQYEYSLSVFLPESGNAEDRLFTIKDLLQLLNISPQSQLYKQLEASATEYHKKGFLWQLLCEIASQCGHNKRETGVQTDHAKFPPPTSLEEEFRKLDTHYASISDDWRSRGSLIEERILTYQKQLEDRTRNELQLEMARFKENELSRMRLEEREKCRKELESTRKEMERTYRTKSDALLERERHAAERMQQQEEMSERESYSRRQAVLDEIEAVRQKETQLRREQENDKKEKELWEQKIKTREQAAKERQDVARKLEIEYEQKLRNEMDKYKIEEQSRYLDRYKNIEYRESRVKENERRLDDELQTIKDTKDELRAKRLRVNEVESELVKCQHDLIGARKQEEILSDRLREMVDYQILKEESAVLRKELEHAKQRAAESNRESVIARQKHEELLREMTERAAKPSPEAYLMKQQLDKAQNDLKQERAIFDHHRSQQERRLQEEIQRNHELLQKFEENTLQQKHMNREMNDVQSQLFSTRQALSNEVYRKPQTSGVTSQILALQESLRLDKSDSLCSVDGFTGGQQAPVDDGPAGPDLMYEDHDPIIEDILNRAPAEAVAEPSQSDDYSYSSDLVVETKRRLKNLEREAEHLEENYRTFQYRMTSVHSALETEPIRPSPNKSRVSFREQIGMPITSTTREGLRSPYASPRNNLADVSRPMSSTPARSSVRTTSDRHFYTSPAVDLDRDQSLINARMSPVHSPREDHGRRRQRPLSVDDLEARPGSPSVVVVPGSGSSSGQQGAAADLSFQDSRSESRAPPPAAAPVSLDSAWKQTQQNLQVSLDSAWKDQEADRKRQEEEDRKYEEERRKREEERKRREEEAWEREQRELERLERQQKGLPPREEEKPKEEPKEEAAAGIDPVMQKYMEMVKQQKEKEKESEKIAKKTVSTWSKGRKFSQDKTPSQSEEISIGSGARSDKSDDGIEPPPEDDFW